MIDTDYIDYRFAFFVIAILWTIILIGVVVTLRANGKNLNGHVAPPENATQLTRADRKFLRDLETKHDKHGWPVTEPAVYDQDKDSK
jgi:hypothetical protein